MVRVADTVALIGLEGFEVTVECNNEKGLPEVSVIGLPDTSVKEAIDRIESAAFNNGIVFPRGKTIINLAPADKKKQGSSYDLPIIVSMMLHTTLENVDVDDATFIGELSLKGELRPVSGILPMCLTAKRMGKKRIFLPKENAGEATVIKDIEVYGVANISQLVNHLLDKEHIEPEKFNGEAFNKSVTYENDMCRIKGQERAKRALEIAAAGEHNVLMIGPPGSGKSMLAKAFCSILPDMTYDEMIEATNVHSVSGLLTKEHPVITERPFRSPHHTVSNAGIMGGGTTPSAGEISLAHRGVLFLDELPEFERRTLESLRQPLEDGSVTIARAGYKLTYPADFTLICAMNPCPCGYFGSDNKQCTCTSAMINRYMSKISGPLLDRMDIQIEVPALSFDEINSNAEAEKSAEIKKRVNSAKQYRAERIQNGIPDSKSMTEDAVLILEKAFDRLGLSARGYDRTVRVARTIADLDKSEKILKDHIFEAVQMRSLDKKYFNLY